MSPRSTSLLSITVGAVLAAATASAQETAPADTLALEEVVVTSRRVQESLQETPISVSAFRAEDIEQMGMTNIGDAAKFAPGFTTTAGPTGGNDAFFFIRGVGQVDLNAATDPGVGTYIDGVYLGRIMGASFDTMDIDQIEVLRGPQGTLFGRNTMGGAINVTSHTPTGDLGGKISVLGGNYDLKGVKGRIDFPMGDMVAGTVSGLWREQEGYATRASDGKTFGDAETKAARAKFVINQDGPFTATFGADWTEVEGTAQHNLLTAFNSDPTVASPLGVPLPQGMAQYVNTTNLFVNNSSIDPIATLDVAGANLTLEWKGDAIGVKSITAYRELEQFHANDFDGSPFTFYDGAFDTDQDQLSQELQLLGEAGNTRWVVGGYYYKESAFHNNAISMGGNNGCLPVPGFVIPPGNPYPSCFATTPPTQYATPGVNRQLRQNQAFDLDVEALAAFAHLNFQFSDQWSASLGVRWTDETKEQGYNFSIENTAPGGVASFAGIPPTGQPLFPGGPSLPPQLPTFAPGSPQLVPGTPTTYEQSWSEVTPSASVEFKPNDALMVYLSYAEGFKSGGFAGRPTAIVAGPNTGRFGPVDSYDPEKLQTYELGLKSQFAEDRVRLNASVYYSEYQDIQLLVLTSTSAGAFFTTTNAAESEIKGVELELLALPTAALQLQATVAYNDNEYTQLDPGTIASGIGFDDRLPLTPELTYSLAADYTWDFAGGAALTLHGNYSWRDDVYYGATNFANEFQESFGLLGARATYTFAGEAFSISAYGSNLTDEEYLSNGQDVVQALGVAFSSVGAPRLWGVEATYKFGAE